ncbi:MAG: hypothetical protein AABZ53_10755 [Planctomycetota bacterium]
MLTRNLLVPAIACVAFLAGCDGKITQTNYDKVTVGMSISNVVDILGKGERQTQSGAARIAGDMVNGIPGAQGKPKESNRERWIWKSDKAEISVDFDDGKVVGKNQLGL